MNSMTREMKDSGIEWVGKIPVSWSIKKLNAFYSRKTIKNHPNERVLSVYREYGVIPKDSRSDNHNVTSENTSAYLLVQPTNLVVNKMKAWQGSMGISNHQGIVSPAYFVYQETAVPRERRFFHYLLRSNIYAQEFRRLSRGMREGQWDLTAYDFERTPIIVPPLLEQQQIATFLDIKCSQIDRLSDNIKQQIEELGEYKKALITQAITKGLDPDVEMKDSGIAWVGNIPQKWEVSPLYVCFKERKNKNKEEQENNLLSLSYGKIVRKPIDILEGLLPESFSTYNIVEKGDIIIRPTDLQNDKKSLRTGLVQEHGIITSAYIDLYLTGIGDVRYYHYLLHAFDEAKVFYNMGNGVRQGLNYSTFSKLPILTPSLEDQSNIADYLDSKCSLIDALVQTKNEKLDTLQDYKKSLVFDYVTGKKEVPADFRKE